MNETSTTLPAALFTRPFEGSPQAADLIARLEDFLHGELAETVRRESIDHERSVERTTLLHVWQRSHALGFYGMTLPVEMGGLGLSLLDHVLVKEAIY
ncbi:MAG: acyl-CoA dehydrogenase, partial [Comamonadaceae bacterium]